MIKFPGHELVHVQCMTSVWSPCFKKGGRIGWAFWVCGWKGCLVREEQGKGFRSCSKHQGKKELAIYYTTQCSYCLERDTTSIWAYYDNNIITMTPWPPLAPPLKVRFRPHTMQCWLLLLSSLLPIQNLIYKAHWTNVDSWFSQPYVYNIVHGK